MKYSHLRGRDTARRRQRTRARPATRRPTAADRRRQPAKITRAAPTAPRERRLRRRPDVFHGCVNNGGCADSTKPVCQTDAGVCVGCLQNGDCTTAGARACDTTANKCVECVVNGDCTNPTKPVCDNQACRGCKVDSRVRRHRPRRLHVPPRRPLRDGLARRSMSRHSDSTAPTRDGDAGTSKVPFCHSQAGDRRDGQPAPPPQTDAGTGNADGGSADGGGADAARKRRRDRARFAEVAGRHAWRRR